MQSDFTRQTIGFIGLGKMGGPTMLLGNMAKQMWGYGVSQGGAKRDSSTLITYLEEWAGVEVRGRAVKDDKRA